jgi:hypothetical protein
MKRDPELPNVPTALEVAEKLEAKEIALAFTNVFQTDRAFFAPPGMPAARVSFLRRTFDKMMRDPELLEASKKSKRPIDALKGEDLEKMVAEILKVGNQKIQPMAREIAQNARLRKIMLEAALEGIVMVMSVKSLAFMLIGILVGLVFGAIPGLSGQTVLAVLLPFVLGLDPVTGMSLLLGAHVAVEYGGSISAILINTPGTGQAIATCWDGYPHGAKRRAGAGAFFPQLSKKYAEAGTLDAEMLAGVAANQPTEEDPGRARKELEIFLWLSFALALIMALGLLIALPMFIFVVLKLRYVRSWSLSLSLALGTFVFMHLLFVKFFHIPLFKGLYFVA